MKNIGYSSKNCKFLLDSIRILGFKKFIITKFIIIIKKILFELEKLKLLADRTTVVETNFWRVAFESLSDKETLKLGKTAQDLFSFLIQFDMFHQVKII